MSAFRPFHMAIGGAKVDGKNQFFGIGLIGLPQRNNHPLKGAQFIVDGGFNIVEIALHIVVGGGITEARARLLTHLQCLSVVAVGHKAKRAAAIECIGEELHFVGIVVVGAHKGENGSAQLHPAHDASHSHLLVELPRGIIDRDIGAR